MTLFEVIDKINAGSALAIFIIISMLIEITPIKISPLKWLGKHINADMTSRMTKIETKLDEHIAESYRNNILSYQDRLLNGEIFTKEEWKKALKSCSAYKQYIEDNDLTNDLIDDAMDYIKHMHKQCLDQAKFLDLKMGVTNNVGA